ncbi:MAG: hypothetical protein ACRDAM_02740, partial [Casimicrobium sp.]
LFTADADFLRQHFPNVSLATAIRLILHSYVEGKKAELNVGTTKSRLDIDAILLQASDLDAS